MSEEENVAALKDWWQRNGKPVTTGVLVALCGVLAWQGWQKYQDNRHQAASAVYQQLLEASFGANGQADAARVSELNGTLQQDYAGSRYAQLAALLAAKVAVDAGQLDDAAAQLRQVLDAAKDEEIAELARQRLARVLSAQDKADEALALIEGEAALESYRASREELRGDLLVQLERRDDALAAYEKAMAALHEDAARGSLQMKLDDLAKGDA